MASIRTGLLVAGLVLSVARGDGAAPPALRTDQLGDPLPPRVVARLGTARLRHNSGRSDITGVVFSPDSRFLASAGWSCVHLWDSGTGKKLRTFTGPAVGFISGLAFSADGRLLAVGAYLGVGKKDESNALLVWNVATGKPVGTFRGNRVELQAVFFRDHGRTLVSVGSDGNVRWWDIAAGKPVRELDLVSRWRDPKGDVRFSHLHAAALAPHGENLASEVEWVRANEKDKDEPIRWRSISVWDLSKGKETWRLEKPKGQGCCPAYSPGGKRLAFSWTAEGPAVYDAVTGKRRTRLVMPVPKTATDGADCDFESSLAFSSDGTKIAVGTQGFGVQVFDSRTGKRLRKFYPLLAPHQINGAGAIRVALSPDGRRVAMSWGQQIFLWDSATGREIPPMAGHCQQVVSLRFARDSWFLTSSARVGSGEVHEDIRWDTRSWKRVSRSEVRLSHGRLCYSDDHRLFVRQTEGGRLFVCERATGKTVCKLQATTEGDSSPRLTFSPNNRLLLLAKPGKAVLGILESEKRWLLDAVTGKLLCEMPESPAGSSFAFSPDNKAVAWFEKDASVQVADTTGKRRWCLFDRPRERHFDRTWYQALTFSPDSRYLASWNYHDEDVYVWDLATGKQHRRLSSKSWNRDYYHRLRLSYSPDGRALAVWGTHCPERHVEVWELATGRRRRRIARHPEPVNAAAFSPDNRLLATGGKDHTVLVWDVTGRAPDGQLRPVRYSAGRLEELWGQLAEADPVPAHRAVWSLVAGPKDAVALLCRLRPVARPNPGRVARLITRLDGDTFAERENAERELGRLAEVAEPTLRDSLAKKPSAEIRRRLSRLLDRARPRVLTAEQLRAVRAVEVLEQIGSREARALLRSLAAGAPSARLTEEASAALRRLGAPETKP
jgi:WD40 repeat protein